MRPVARPRARGYTQVVMATTRTNNPGLDTADPRELAQHPDYEHLFVPADAAEVAALARDMAQGSRFAPLLVNPEGLVMAGVEQWRAALALGWSDISVVRAPRQGRAMERALMVAENVRTRDIREDHLWRGMNNFFDMEPLRPPGGW